jgi:Putative beta-barrel porin-2, OmpL-like. bbp2
MLRKILVTAILLGGSWKSFAQSSEAKVDSTIKDTTAAAPAPVEEVKPTTTINGSVDVYYRYNFANPQYPNYNNYTSFTNSHNRFELGMATVKLEHKTAKFDVVADLGFGKRAQEFAYNDQGILAAIKQLYISYSPKSWLKLTAGSWATHVGYELLDPQLNRNYSMSYMFTNGPFSHTGIRADFTSGKSGFMIGIANPTDYRYVPAGYINKKFLIAQYSYAAGDIFHLYLNYVGGQNIDTSKSSQFDLVATSKLSSTFSLGFNATLNNTKVWNGEKNESSKSWWGSALYLNLDPTPWFGLTLREEYFSDKNGLKVYSGFPKAGSVFASTLSANFKVDGFIFIPEFRLDNAQHEIFSDHDGVGKKSSASFIFAAIYAF